MILIFPNHAVKVLIFTFQRAPAPFTKDWEEKETLACATLWIFQYNVCKWGFSLSWYKIFYKINVGKNNHEKLDSIKWFTVKWFTADILVYNGTTAGLEIFTRPLAIMSQVQSPAGWVNFSRHSSVGLVQIKKKELYLNSFGRSHGILRPDVYMR